MTRKTHPFGFVPIPTDANGTPKSVIDTPVWHDGAQSNELNSGELWLSFRTLTPTLVGNDQFSVTQVEGTVSAGPDKVRLPSEWGIELPVKKDKKVVEPLKLEDGRVAISGASLKGMLMSSIGAFLAAPMQRVAENSYSYRPNLDFPKGGKPFREPRAAIVKGFDTKTGELQVDVLQFNDIGSIYFVQSNARGFVGNAKLGEARRFTGNGYSVFSRAGKHKIGKSPKGNPIPNEPLIALNYHHGVDGRGFLAESFGMNFRGAYCYTLVPEAVKSRADDMNVAPEVLEQLKRSVKHLHDDTNGHIRSTHPQIAGEKLKGDRRQIPVSQYINAVKQTLENVKKPATLIYVEVETAPDGSKRIVSLGQNYRYRWRYRDSVKMTWDGQNDTLRPILAPLSEELVSKNDKNAPPPMLSAVRLLAGYTIDETHTQSDKRTGTGDFSQMAGRLAFNMAVEKLDPEKARPEDRFLSSNASYSVPLKILGPPRSSAEMDYLKQDSVKEASRDIYATYGDTFDAPETELAGRKFYRHQPPVGLPKNFRHFRVSPKDPDVESDQSVIARFISKPGTEFRVKLRYRDLRDWELGAVLAALNPERLSNTGPDGDDGAPTHAQKIGKGRPYGMGSVTFNLDAIKEVGTDGTLANRSGEQSALADKYVQALEGMIAQADCKEAVQAWLDITAYSGLDLCEYPSKEGRGDKTIFNHYTDMRRRYSNARRLEDNRV